MNESLNLLNGRKRRREARWDPPAAPRTPEDELRQAENCAVIQRALERMTVDQRVVIVLKHLLLLPYREIAGTLGISEGTVMSRLFYARKALHGLLKDVCEDPDGAGDDRQ